MKPFFSNLKKTWKYAKNQKIQFITYCILNLATSIIRIIIPILSAKLIVKITDKVYEQIFLMALVIFLFYMLNNIINLINLYCQNYIYQMISRKLQSDLGKEMLKLENKSLDNNSSGAFIQRLTVDAKDISNILNESSSYIAYLIEDIGVYISILYINFYIFIYYVIGAILISFSISYQTKIYSKKEKELKKEEDKVTGMTGEVVRGARDIKMLNAEKSFLKVLDNKIININNMQYKIETSNGNYKFLWYTLYYLLKFILIILIIYLLKNQTLEVAMALVIYNYSDRFSNFGYDLDYLMSCIRKFNLSAERVFSIIEGNEFKKEKFGNKLLDKVEGNFEFKNVSFGYNEKQILNNLNFKINANETVAFVGKSGAGKSTIFSLLDKMYEVNKGEILIDGININELDKDSIRGNITIINQNPYIFNLSIKENLNLVKEDLTEEEMIEACKTACLDEFINTLPNKYDTIVGEGGITLSGGQKQGLAIARALVQKTEIILFDEATSSLDNETQYEIQKAIQNMQGEYTILIIAHRLSTIINSDRILFLNEGKVEAEGTHEELLKTNENYKHLYESELKTK